MDTVGTGRAQQVRLSERHLGWKPPHPRRGRAPSISGTRFIVTVGCHSHTKEEGCAAHSSTFFFLDRNFSLPCDDSGEG